MSFIARLCLPEFEPGMRIYLHESIRDLYGQHVIESATEYLEKIVDSNPKIFSNDPSFKDSDFVIALMRESDKRVIDFRSIREVSGKRVTKRWTTVNGHYNSKFSCLKHAESRLIFDLELDYLRKSKTIEDFKLNPPDFGDRVKIYKDLRVVNKN